MVYSISYFNSGVGGSTGVKLTEIVPENTTYVAEGSDRGWVCDGGAVEAGTVCTLEIGDLPAGGRSTENIIFVLRVNDDVDPNTQSIDNQVLISDDGLAGPSAAGNTVDNFSVDFNALTGIETDFGPGLSGGQTS